MTGIASNDMTSLSPHATARSIGHLHDEPVDALRDPFERDRHRILASTAFRRLQYKTQVFVNDEHDHFRSRLTHTLEVAEIARRLASALRVNANLAESIALAHDLGHAPFGHAGEATLKNLMHDHGGFEHNLHSLRVIDDLEHPYPTFRGLNLTFELREGIIKHASRYDMPAAVIDLDARLTDLLAVGPQPSVEAQIANVADRIAYDIHDLEDALGARLIYESDVSELELWSAAAGPVRSAFPKRNVFTVRRPILDGLLDTLLKDVIAESTHRLGMIAPNPDAVRAHDDPVVAFSESTSSITNELEGFLAIRVYRHHRLIRMDAKARRFIERLFAAYVQDPEMLPPRFAARLDALGTHRVVCDYIAGMTDRFCQDDYKKLFQPNERV